MLRTILSRLAGNTHLIVAQLGAAFGFQRIGDGQICTLCHRSSVIDSGNCSHRNLFPILLASECYILDLAVCIGGAVISLGICHPAVQFQRSFSHCNRKAVCFFTVIGGIHLPIDGVLSGILHRFCQILTIQSIASAGIQGISDGVIFPLFQVQFSAFDGNLLDGVLPLAVIDQACACCDIHRQSIAVLDDVNGARNGLNGVITQGLLSAVIQRRSNGISSQIGGICNGVILFVCKTIVDIAFQFFICHKTGLPALFFGAHLIHIRLGSDAIRIVGHFLDPIRPSLARELKVHRALGNGDRSAGIKCVHSIVPCIASREKTPQACTLNSDLLLSHIGRCGASWQVGNLLESHIVRSNFAFKLGRAAQLHGLSAIVHPVCGRDTADNGKRFVFDQATPALQGNGFAGQRCAAIPIIAPFSHTTQSEVDGHFFAASGLLVFIGAANTGNADAVASLGSVNGDPSQIRFQLVIAVIGFCKGCRHLLNGQCSRGDPYLEGTDRRFVVRGRHLIPVIFSAVRHILHRKAAFPYIAIIFVRLYIFIRDGVRGGIATHLSLGSSDAGADSSKMFCAVIGTVVALHLHRQVGRVDGHRDGSRFRLFVIDISRIGDLQIVLPCRRGDAIIFRDGILTDLIGIEGIDQLLCGGHCSIFNSPEHRFIIIFQRFAGVCGIPFSTVSRHINGGSRLVDHQFIGSGGRFHITRLAGLHCDCCFSGGLHGDPSTGFQRNFRIFCTVRNIRLIQSSLTLH